MVGSMTGSYPRTEVLPGPERRRRWSIAEKLAMVDETREPGATVSLVARRRGAATLTFQSHAGRKDRHPIAANLVRALQRVAPASCARLSLSERVHRSQSIFNW